ncbi:hypothetical protein ACTFIR_011320 [Dictyostelium discoideum]
MISPPATTTTTTNEIESIPSCIEYGFFYILNHSIEQSLIDRLMGLSKKFFSLPLEVKMKTKINIGENHKEGTFLDLETNINKASNGISQLYPTKEEEELYDIVGFKDTCETFMKSLTQFSIELMGLIAISLNLPKDYFNDLYLQNPNFILGLLKYKSFDDDGSDGKTTKFGNESHCDWSLFTLLYQDDVGGLQALSKSTGSFIFNIGDMLEIITKGYYTSMFHQVIYNTSGRDLPINNSETTTTTTTSTSKIGNYVKDPNILNFKGTYNDYHIIQMNKSFNK